MIEQSRQRIKEERVSLDVQSYALDDEEEEIRFAYKNLNEQWDLLAEKANAKSPKGSQRSQSETLASETVAGQDPILATEAIPGTARNHKKNDTVPEKITRNTLSDSVLEFSTENIASDC